MSTKARCVEDVTQSLATVLSMRSGTPVVDLVDDDGVADDEDNDVCVVARLIS